MGGSPPAPLCTAAEDDICDDFDDVQENTLPLRSADPGPEDTKFSDVSSTESVTSGVFCEISHDDEDYSYVHVMSPVVPSSASATPPSSTFESADGGSDYEDV